jgi:hypothetical protein
MIEPVMLCGIGLLGGCLLMLAFLPVVHDRAVRLTKRQLAESTPMTVSEIQAEKDHLRAEFAMSVRRLEVRMEEMRVKAMNRTADKQHSEVSRLRVELDRKSATIFALRAREKVRSATVRRGMKVLLYLFVRSRRHSMPAEVSPLPPDRDRRLDQRAKQSELAAAAAAITALNLKRRQVISSRY